MIDIDNLLNEFLVAVASEFRGLGANPQFRRNAEFYASKWLGFDVTSNPFVYAQFNKAFDNALAYADAIADGAKTDPEGSAEFVREKGNELSDGIAEALRKRRENKNS